MENTQKFFEAFAETGCHAYLRNASFDGGILCSPEVQADAAQTLAAYLESPDAESWLDFQVYRNAASGEYWAEATVALGGPTASFTYDIYRAQLTFSYSWAGKSVTVDIDTDAGAGADIAQLIRDYAEA